MAKKTGSKSVKTVTAAAPQRKTPTKKKTKIPKQVIDRTCGLVDPFCPHAVGAKYPDDSSYKTLAHTFKYTQNITTTANGDVAYLFWPQYGRQDWTTALSGSGPSITAWNTISTDSGAFSEADSYRIVSAGFVVRSIVAPLEASGMINIRSWPVENGSNMGVVDTSGYNSTASINVPLRKVDQVTCISQHTSAPPANFYPIVDGPSQDVTDVPGNGFGPVTIYVSGAPVSQVVLQVECIVHYELTMKPESNMQQIATRPPPHSSMLTNFANRVTSTIEPFMERGVSAFGNYVVRKATQAVGSYFGGPAIGAGASLMIKDVD